MRHTGLVFTVLVLLQGCCFAWLDKGHMIVAQIAYTQVSSDVRSHIDTVLGALFQLYPNQFQSLAASAVWPDSLKAVKLDAMDNWHYIDYAFLTPEFKNSGGIAGPDAGADVLYAIAQGIATLGAPASDAYGQCFFTSYLAHLVGDLHQPLHCASRYSTVFPTGDLGGNLINVTYADGRNWPYNNLHAFWDGGAGYWQGSNVDNLFNEKGQQFVREQAEALMKITPRSTFTDQQLDPSNVTLWSLESFQDAIDVVYKGMTDTQTTMVITEDYIKTAQALVLKRIPLAGYRLANIFEMLLKGKKAPEIPFPRHSVGSGVKAYIGIVTTAFVLLVFYVIWLKKDAFFRGRAQGRNERDSLIPDSSSTGGSKIF